MNMERKCFVTCDTLSNEFTHKNECLKELIKNEYKFFVVVDCTTPYN